eukprot:Plantae.Rhodophyta-Rhodochaete_pulchella.ctg7641.p1 GENE.Plantae.Rhodophyta-Rhodochaete_pulchella.ctg7641~~Plantae.Rhodophyta-Rhodochaete_pulchella.ctg7641.p1  ORF type:complete len:214 (-),score=14.48 Plantae.Rhodophyta-Rhodochaete_pulchella.ctg7641:799-1440(-)
MSITDLRIHGLDIGIQRNELYCESRTQKILVENDFLWLRWKAEETRDLFTDAELQRIHRAFGHPSASALVKVLKHARPAEMLSSAKQAVENLSRACTISSKRSSRPKHFKLTVGADDLRFNRTVTVDVMYLLGRPMLQVVDEATHFAAARFLPSATVGSTWRIFVFCWIRTSLDHRIICALIRVRILQQKSSVQRHEHLTSISWRPRLKALLP